VTSRGNKAASVATTDSQLRHSGPNQHPGQPDLRVVTLYQPGTIVLAVSGELDIASAPVLRDHLEFAFGRQPAQIVLDLAGLKFCDAAGLSVFAMARQRTGTAGILLALAAVPRRLSRLLTITDMRRFLDVYPSVAAAAQQPRGGGALAGGALTGQAQLARGIGDLAAR
jgi:anti-sigma B factor antagonist